MLSLLADLRRYALSSLVNSLLHAQKPIPFEILINGQFLRSSIDDFLKNNGISTESTLTVEYTRALIPPLRVATFEHDDWVSAVDVLSGASPAGASSESSAHTAPGHERILSASYDGLVRVWDMSGEVIATSTAPANGGRITSLKAARFVSPERVVAAGLDATVRVLAFSDADRTLTPSLDLYGHTGSVDGLAVHPASARILSASADGTVRLWSSSPASAPAAPADLLPNATVHANKRMKLAASSAGKTPPQRGALATLSGHAAPASAVVFAPGDATVAHSAALDHSLRTWDLTTGALVDTRTTGHALLSLAALPALGLLAAGSSARHIALVDPRAAAATVAALTLRGHANKVVALGAQPRADYGLVSASHDGTCRVWDVRSVRAAAAGADGGAQVGECLYVLDRQSAAHSDGRRTAAGDGVKVFGVRWDHDVGIVSGGEDRRVQINRGGKADEA